MAASTKNRRTSIITLSLGAVCVLVTVILGFNVGGLADALPTAGKGVWGFGGCAVALIICGIASLFHKPSRSELVSEADERNIAIRSRAAERAFNLFSVLAPIAALVLFAFDQITTVGVLVVIGAEVVSFVAYLVWIAKIQRSM